MEQRLIDSASWIAADKKYQAPVFCRKFQANQPTNGYIELTGLGYLEAYLNGRKITEDRYVPAMSDYEKRDFHHILYPNHDNFTHRIYYLRYDCSSLLCDGENILEIRLGNGFYRQCERTAEGTMHFGEELKTIFAIEFLDMNGNHIVLSDGSETVRESEIVYNNLFIGEVHDARRLHSEFLWDSVHVPEAPKAELCLQTCPADRVIRVIIPILIAEKDGKRIYDAGENISGNVLVVTKGSFGEEVQLRYAEHCKDGELDFASTGAEFPCETTGNQIMTDKFICDGQKRSFEAVFTWHAFRYFEVTGPIESVTVQVIHSDVPVTSTFACDCESINWLYETYLRTQLNNMHGGVPSDCPHRERLGYTGDGQITAKAAMLMTDSRLFYKKWIQDILDCQDIKGGHVQHTAPFMGGGGGPGGWGCAIVLVPYIYYKHYGELEVLKEAYEPMKKWISYLEQHCEDGLVVREEEGGWCLGDWCTLGKCALPTPYVNTYYFIKCLDILKEIAPILDKSEDIVAFETICKKLRESITRHYYDVESGNFCNNIQGANAYAADICLGDERTLQNLYEYYSDLGHFDTGFLGTDILLDVLFANGKADLAYQLLNSEEMGSFMYMKNHGATTLWEMWDGRDSHNHPMFGGCSRQLFQSILGIRQKEDCAGYSNVMIAPQIIVDMQFAKGSILTAHGRISVEWKKQKEGLSFVIEIPDDVCACFCYGDKEVSLKQGRQEICIF